MSVKTSSSQEQTDPAVLDSGWRYFFDWSQRYAQPTLIVGHDLSVIWINTAARSLFSREGSLTLVDDRLVFSDALVSYDFAEFLQNCMREPMVWLHAQGGDHAYLLFRGEGIAPDGLPPGVGLVVQQTDGSQRYVWADIRKVFNLTAAELRVVTHLLDGQTADATAGLLGISIETTRTHIKRIYTKMDVSSREGLFARVIPFRAI